MDFELTKQISIAKTKEGYKIAHNFEQTKFFGIALILCIKNQATPPEVINALTQAYMHKVANENLGEWLIVKVLCPKLDRSKK